MDKDVITKIHNCNLCTLKFYAAVDSVLAKWISVRTCVLKVDGSIPRSDRRLVMRNQVAQDFFFKYLFIII